MRIVLQRVRRAGVARAAEPEQATTIGRGYVLLVGVAEGDDEGTARRLAADVAKVRLMEDDAGKIGRSLKDAGGEVLAVSQFTLLADFSKGNRPSFHRAASSSISSFST
jgi:D-tyrosyl-tRNA(Tyr) deacylase